MHQGKSANTVWILVGFLPGVEPGNQEGQSKKIDNEPSSARKWMSLPNSRSENLPGDWMKQWEFTMSSYFWRVRGSQKVKGELWNPLSYTKRWTFLLCNFSHTLLLCNRPRFQSSQIWQQSWMLSTEWIWRNTFYKLNKLKQEKTM